MIKRTILNTAYQRDWVFNVLKLLTFVGFKKYIHNILFALKAYTNNNKKQWKYYTKHICSIKVLNNNILQHSDTLFLQSNNKL